MNLEMKFQLILLTLSNLAYIRCQTVTDAFTDETSTTIKTEFSMDTQDHEVKSTYSSSRSPTIVNTTNTMTSTKPDVELWHLINNRRTKIPPIYSPLNANRVFLTSNHPHIHTQINQHPPRTVQYSYPWITPQLPQTANVCQGQTTKRDDKTKMLEPYYLNIENHDIMFSVCGTLLPAHRILLESESPKFSVWIKKRINAEDNKENEPIMIQSINDLIDGEEINKLPNVENQCPDEILLSAFKIFLKYFYFGLTAFDSIDNFDVSLLVFNLTRTFLDDKIVGQFVEAKIIHLMNMKNLARVYHFINDNKIDSLKEKWSKYIAENSALFGKSEPLPFSCQEITEDVRLLDNFLQSLNSTQAQVIKYIRYYLENCPKTIKEVIKDASSLPNSLFFFRCTIDDLKELNKIGFVTMEILAEEFENRLRAKERVCEEIKKISAYNNYAYRRQMEPYLGSFRPRE